MLCKNNTHKDFTLREYSFVVVDVNFCQRLFGLLVLFTY